MAENNTYNLYIHFGNAEETQSVVAGGQKAQGAQSANNSPSDPSAPSAKQQAGKIMGYAAMNYKFAETLIGYEYSQVSLRTGAAEYQQRLQLKQNVVKKTMGSLGGAVATGLMTGGVAGAVAGFAMYVMYDYINYRQRVDMLRTQKGIEDIGRDMMNVRAGVSGSRGRNQ